MSERVRLGLRLLLPLITTSLVLTGMDVIPDGQLNWAYWPVLGMMFPILRIAGNILLGDDKIKSKEREQTVVMPAAQVSVAMDASLQQELRRVNGYQAEIDSLARKASNSIQRDNLNELSRQFGDWRKDATQLAQRISDFKTNTLIQNDLANVPQAIRKLLAQVKEEKDDRVRTTLERTLATRSQQWDSLQKLQSTMRNAEAQFENTCASLGTLYSQALTGQGTNTVADYSHLAREVNDEVQALRDQLNALEDIKLGRAENLSRPAA